MASLIDGFGENMEKLTLMDMIAYADTLLKQGKSNEVIDYYQRCLASPNIDPQAIFVVLFNLGVLLRNANRLAECIAVYQQALTLKPTFYQAAINLGLALEASGQPEQALKVWENALQPFEAQTQLMNHIGRVYESTFRYPEADTTYRRSLKLLPEQPQVVHHYLFLRQKQCVWPLVEPFADVSEEILLAYCSPMTVMAMTDDPAMQLQTMKAWSQRNLPKNLPHLAPKSGYNHQKLRLGYISCDFRWHAVSILTAEIFELHNRELFEVYGFDYSMDDKGSMRQRVIQAMDHHIPLHTLSDEAAAGLIRELEIDILIDLTGITSGGRPAILCYKPAPIQISYLGFVGTSAIPEVDYVLADRFVFPEELCPYFVEKPLYLPEVFQSNDSKRAIADRPSRADCHLPEEAFVFCSFNGSYKISQSVFGIWMRILNRVPNSVLWLVADNETAMRNLVKEAEEYGIDSKRLIFADRVPPPMYLARYQVGDLLLDTSPYNAGTMASDALWAGLPVLTCPGRTFASRMAGSLLHAVGLPELVASSFQEYEDLAVALALDAPRLKAIRQYLQLTSRQSALFDSKRFVRNLDAVLFDAVNQLKKQYFLTDLSHQPESEKHGATPGKLAEKTVLLVEGWRSINHSYSLVNQYQLLALSKQHQLSIFHRDMPYISQKWNAKDAQAGLDSQDLSIINAFPSAPLPDPDIVYRIYCPFNLNPVAHGKLFTFIVTETGLNDNAFPPGQIIDVAKYQDSGGMVITPSNWSKQRLINFGFNPHVVKVIPHGINRKYFYPLPVAQRQSQRAALGYKDNEIVLLNIGATGFWNKGVDVLIKAFAIVRETRKDLRLLIKDQSALYGGGSDNFVKKTLASIGKLNADVIGAISLLSADLNLDQLRALYNVADCYVSSYRAEGFNLPVLEAMACGTYVITTDGGSTDDFVPAGRGSKINSIRYDKVVIQNNPVDAYLEPSLEHLVELLLTVKPKPEMAFDQALDFSFQQQILQWEQVTARLLQVFSGVEAS